jgi:hypothetical protein
LQNTWRKTSRVTGDCVSCSEGRRKIYHYCTEMYDFVNGLQTVLGSSEPYEIKSNAHRDMVLNLEGQNSLRRPRHIWKFNINMGIIGTEVNGVY